MGIILFLYVAALVVVTIWSRIPDSKPIEPPRKFACRPCGPWAYFADKIVPRQFEIWTPPQTGKVLNERQ